MKPPEDQTPEEILRVDPTNPYAVLGEDAQNMRKMMMAHHGCFAAHIISRMLTVDAEGNPIDLGGMTPFDLLSLEELQVLQTMLLAEIANYRDWSGMDLVDAANKIATSHQIKAAFSKVRQKALAQAEEDQDSSPKKPQARGAGFTQARQADDVSTALAAMTRPKSRAVPADRVPSDLLRKQVDS